MEPCRTGEVHGAQRRGPAGARQRALPQRAQALLAHDAGLPRVQNPNIGSLKPCLNRRRQRALPQRAQALLAHDAGLPRACELQSGVRMH